MTTAVTARITERWLADHVPARDARSHKGDFGHVLVVAGSLEYPGAAVLTGLGAMRAGAGVVRVASPEAVSARMASAVPELTWMALDEEAPGLIARAAWRRLAAEAAEYDAIVIGPGLGRLPASQRRIRGLLAAIRRPTVVDADGLNALAADAGWPGQVVGPLVLTPHPGEFARLMAAPVPQAADDAGRETAAMAAAQRWGQVVILKGAHTVIAAPGGSLLRSTVATPALATAGSGDVLAGAIGALLAAGLAPFEAAGCGVGLHATAGLLAEERLGAAGPLATDIAALLVDARRMVGGGSA